MTLARDCETDYHGSVDQETDVTPKGVEIQQQQQQQEEALLPHDIWRVQLRLDRPSLASVSPCEVRVNLSTSLTEIVLCKMPIYSFAPRGGTTTRTRRTRRIQVIIGITAAIVIVVSMLLITAGGLMVGMADWRSAAFDVLTGVGLLLIILGSIPTVAVISMLPPAFTNGAMNIPCLFGRAVFTEVQSSVQHRETLLTWAASEMGPCIRLEERMEGLSAALRGESILLGDIIDFSLATDSEMSYGTKYVTYCACLRLRPSTLPCAFARPVYEYHEQEGELLYYQIPISGSYTRYRDEAEKMLASVVKSVRVVTGVMVPVTTVHD